MVITRCLRKCAATLLWLHILSISLLSANLGSNSSLASKYQTYRPQFQAIVETFKTSTQIQPETKSPVWLVDGEKSSVYLVGSIHLLSESDYPLNEALETAYDHSEVLVLEINPDSAATPQFAQLTMAKGMYPEGKNLKSEIPAELFGELQAELEKSGLPVENFLRFRPWLIAVTLTAMELQKLGFNAEYGLDRYFFNKAKQDSKEVLALETPAFQIGLFSKMDDTTQEQMLLETLHQLHTLESAFADMLEAWKYGRAATLDSLMNEHMRTLPDLKKELLDDRNKRWVTQIEGFLEDDRDVMVVVGAGHLVGENSVVDLLRKRGYSVKQL